MLPHACRSEAVAPDQSKTEISLPKMMSGAVCAQMIRCGKESCRCATGQLHGPYFYHFARVNGVLKKRYLRLDSVEAITEACRNYRAERVRQRREQRESVAILVTIRDRIRRSEAELVGVREVFHASN
jgi:hypothetical protein